MSKTAVRHEALLLLLSARGYVSIDELAAHFDVTAQTVRKDINALAREGKVVRFHGGAGFPAGVGRQAGDMHIGGRSSDAGCRIGALVAGRIPAGASVCINSGPTQESVARALLKRRKLRVITNSLPIAQICSDNSECEVWVAGGVMRRGDGGVFGGGAEGFIREFKADYGILGVPCIDEDGNLLEQDLHRAAVAKAIIESSRFVFLAVAASCFGSSAVARVAHLSSIQAVFSNAPLDDRWKKLADAAGTPLHLV